MKNILMLCMKMKVLLKVLMWDPNKTGLEKRLANIL